MIIRATAIPLAVYPYSSTSHIVHWLTRFQGKISTILKGALRPTSRFLGEYELFSTSELLYYAKPNSTLYTAKECTLLERRAAFRTDWRAMQAASYLAVLFNRTTPEDAPHPELFGLFEELLDAAQDFGAKPGFLPWAELKFCDAHGHAPNFERCVICSAKTSLRFCASQGGVVCGPCAKEKKLPTLECPPDVLAVLRSWAAAEHPLENGGELTAGQRTAVHAVLSTFMSCHFNLSPEYRAAVSA